MMPNSIVPSKTACRAARISRRGVLEIGWSTALGLGIGGLAQGRVSRAAEEVSGSVIAGVPRARSVLFVFLFGGPSQLDTFDPKPEAPVEYRSQFRTIATAVPGVAVCEHLPGLAQRAGQYALVRTLSCNPNFGDHRLAVHGLLGGIDELPPGAGLAASRRDWPSLAAGVNYLRPARGDGLPNSMVLAGEVTDPATGMYPGQSAGLLGAKHDPYWLKQDPSDPAYQVDHSLAMPAGLTVERLASKRQLLAQLDAQQARLEGALETAGYTARQQEAWGVLTGGRLANCLDLSQEKPETRDRYGQNVFGQTLLMSRRLVEAGVPIVQANCSYQALWDTHYNNFVGLAEHLPKLDLGMSALFDDLADSGLLEETLVVMMGEFGRTPKLVLPNGSSPYFTSPGRDHWMSCFWAVFAGAGVRGGTVMGRSDAVAAYPVTRPYTPADVGATVYAALGIEPRTKLNDMQGRPLVLNAGRPMEALYTGGEG